jgi:hypothetical protein
METNYMPTKDAITQMGNFGMALDSVVNISFDALIREKIEIDSILRLDSVRHLYIDKYNRDTAMRKIHPIEALDSTTKMELWRMAGEYTDDRDRRLEASKIIYLIECMCQNQLDA